MKPTREKVHRIIDTLGRIVGISLGYDQRSEHQQGIHRMRAVFGITERSDLFPVGDAPREAFAVRVFPTGLHWFEEGKYSYLVLHSQFPRRPPTGAEADRWLRAESNQELACAWSDGYFAIRTNDPSLGSFLHRLRMALEDQDALLVLGDRVVAEVMEHAARPLVLLVSSMIGDDDLKLLFYHYKSFEEKGAVTAVLERRR